MSEKTPPASIRLSEDWRITWDGSSNWILEQQVWRTSREGERYEDWENTKYYSDLGALARSLFRQGMTQLSEMDIRQLFAHISMAEIAVTRAIFAASGWPDVEEQRDEQIQKLLSERARMIEGGALPDPDILPYVPRATVAPDSPEAASIMDFKLSGL